MKRGIRRLKQRIVLSDSQRVEVAKDIFHGLTMKQAAFKWNVSEAVVYRIRDEFIMFKMVWNGPEFQEELTLEASPVSDPSEDK